MSETSSVESGASPERRPVSERLAARLRLGERLLLVTHDRPDGDALGSMLALGRAARAGGKTVRMVCGDVPRAYAFLAAGETFVHPDDLRDAAAASDRVVILDTCSLAQLTEVRDVIVSSWPNLLVIDHHRTGHDIAPLRWRDPSAAATGVMVAELLDLLGWPLDKAVAEPLMAAVCTDTGWLRFSSTDARALAAVGRCIDAGVEPDGLYRALYENDRPERLALLRRLLASLRYHDDGRVALMTLSVTDFTETGATRDETENLISEALRVGAVQVAVLLVEQEGLIRGSLRSKPTSGVDVARLAGRLGGGGHARAAGFRLNGPLTEAPAKVLEALECH
ncbi:MAG: DHH family phosphoesterase [Planctomycetota bacterium]